MAVKINLMPERVDKNFSKQKHHSFFYLATIFLFIASLFVFWGVSAWRNYFFEKDLGRIKTQNDSLNADISQKIESPYLVLGEKSKNVEKILIDHLYWSRFYKSLETFTPKDISYKNFTSDASSAKDDVIKARIGGESNSFKALAKQMVALGENKDIIGVEPKKAEINKAGKVDFEVEISFKRSLLKFANEK